MFFDTDNISLYLWGLGLVALVPIFVIIMGEVVERLQRRDSYYTDASKQLRGIILPIVVAYIIVHQLLAVPQESTFSKTITTLLWVAGAYLLFDLFRAISTAGEETQRLEARIPSLFKGIARALSILIPLYYVVSGVWGVQLSSLVTAIGVGSLVVALALQDTLSSIVSGFLLVLDKPFAIGDWIEIDGYTGKVVDLNWRSTRIMVQGRDIVVIPNTTLVGSSIYNLTMIDPGYREEIGLGFSYDDPPNKVKQVMLEMAHESPHVRLDPAPELLTVSYDDSSIGYELIFHVERFTSPLGRKRIRDDLLTRVFYAASRAGLNIPFPIETVYEHHVPFHPPTPKELEAARLALLSSDVYFAHLPEEQLQWLAERSTFESFGKGEYLYRAGENNERMMMIHSGQLELLLPTAATVEKSGKNHRERRPENSEGRREEKRVALLSSGELAGEMVLVSNRVNPVSCRVLADVELLVLTQDVIHKVVTQQPRFALHLDRFIEERIRLIDAYATREELSQSGQTAEARTTKSLNSAGKHGR